MRDRKRDDFIQVILLEEVLKILQNAKVMFDVLEYSYIVTLQSVLPAYSAITVQSC